MNTLQLEKMLYLTDLPRRNFGKLSIGENKVEFVSEFLKAVKGTIRTNGYKDLPPVLVEVDEIKKQKK